METMQTFRVIIAGGRNFSNYHLLEEKCNYYLQNKIKQGLQIVIISGHARGADLLGEKFARLNGHSCEQYPADWETHGRKAGMIRNYQLANEAEALIAFWDGQSVGTKHMIETAKSKGLKVAIVSY